MSKRSLKQRLQALYNGVDAAEIDQVPDDDAPGPRVAEFEIMIEEALGPDYDFDKRRALIGLEDSFRGRQQALIHDLEAGRVSPQAYLTQMNELMVDMAHRYQAILGEADYQKLFGGRPEDAAHLIDPAIFLGETAEEEPEPAK